MPVSAFVGTLGSGKTLFMSFLAALEMQRGRPVWANYALHGATRLNTWDELFATSDGLICLDELQVLVDSREFSKKENKVFSQWLLQTRKAGLELWFTTQHIEQVDKRVRGVLDWLFFLDRRSRRVPMSTVHMFDFQFGIAKGRRTLLHSPALYGLYDTYQKITMLE